MYLQTQTASNCLADFSWLLTNLDRTQNHFPLCPYGGAEFICRRRIKRSLVAADSSSIMLGKFLNQIRPNAFGHSEEYIHDLRIKPGSRCALNFFSRF